MSKPSDYKEQDSCANCTFCEVISDYDYDGQLYCNHDKTKRPKSGSVFMSERFKYPDDTNLPSPDMIEWQKWSEGREVEPQGICAKHKRD